MAEPRHRSLFRRIVGGFFAWFGFVVALILVLAIVARFVFAPVGETIANNSVLTIDLTEPFEDGPPQSSLERALLGPKPSLREVVDTITAAANDSRIDGMMARVGDGGISLAEIQELRDAIAAFRAKGKFAYAYADSFGELGGGTGAYYLATAFGEIWLQPYSNVGLVGLRAEQPFFHGTLDKIGVAPRMDHREEYKSAMNMFTETKMTPAQREETDSLLKSLLGQIVRGIAETRKIPEADVRTVIEKGPYTSDEAVVAKLVDHLGYRDTVVGAVRTGASVQRHLLPIDKYADGIAKPHKTGPTVAIIYADGLIQRGKSADSPLGGSSTLGAETLVTAFRQASEDSAVRAILFRIDSPGGSAVASESIWEATVLAKKAGKPLIVSMGNVAGSGGYYIAAAADKIVAQPATLTGSIGVVGGKFLIAGLSEKLGITWDSTETSPNGGMLSTTQDFTPEGHARFERFLDDVYDGFKDRVARGRQFDAAKVEAVAKGRVWTGEEAKANGLVDALGGFELALGLAKEAAKIPVESDVTLKQFPKEERTLLAQLLGRGEADALLSPLKPYLRMLTLVTAPPGALTMAPIEIH